MDPTEAAEAVQEAGETRGGEDCDDRFRSRVALWISILAVLLAVTGLGGGNVAEDMFNSNIEASNAWAFYQAKNVRQTFYEQAAADLETRLLRPDLTPAEKQRMQELSKKYLATAERYESEPDPEAPNDPKKGDGKKQIRARAEDWQKHLAEAQKKDPNFDFAEVFYQIAIVLASVAILSLKRPILVLSLVAGAIATVLMVNGFTLWMTLPF